MHIMIMQINYLPMEPVHPGNLIKYHMLTFIIQASYILINY